MLRLLLTMSVLATAALAQTARYRDVVFPNVTVTRDLAFGSALNRWTSSVETLALDLYTPTGDTVAQRPAMVVVHGGGFTGGDKRTAAIVQLANVFAQRGYVAISINYRLAPPNTPITPVIINDAMEDCKAAIRWLRRYATTYRIDVDRIASVGSSAGAYTVLQAAYVAGEGNSGNPGYRSDVRCVIDLWGALIDLNTMQPGEVPVCIIHGTNDPIVPYTNATNLNARATAVGIAHELHPLNGSGHAPWNLLPQFTPAMVAFAWEHMQLSQLAGLAARPGYGSPGTLTLDHFGIAGDAIVLGVSAGQVSVPLPGYGILCLDPASLLLLPAINLDPTPRLPSRSVTLSVPGGLGGQTLYWQTVHLQAAMPRTLSNCVATGF